LLAVAGFVGEGVEVILIYNNPYISVVQPSVSKEKEDEKQYDSKQKNKKGDLSKRKKHPGDKFIGN